MSHDERLLDAAFEYNLALVRELLTSGVDVNSRDAHNSTALEYAAEFGQLEMVMLLIENGADINNHNKDGETPLYCAGDNGHMEIEKMLRDAGAIT